MSTLANFNFLTTRTIIQKIRDSDAGGMQSVKSENYFHGFIPTKQTTFLLREIGDFLVRQTVKGDLKNSSREQFVISIRMNESFYVPNGLQQAYKNWVKEGRKEENAIKGIVDDYVYNDMDEKERDLYALVEEGVGHFIMKYSRRGRLYYMHTFGFTHSSGLIDYHMRHKLSVSPGNPQAIIRRAVRKEEWQFNHEQIERVKRLGEGAFGEVFMGRLRLGLVKEIDVAVKTITGTVTADEIAKLFEEAMLMQRLEHPNVVKFFGVASNDDPVMIVMELCTGGSVLDAVRLCKKTETEKPPPTIARKIEYIRGAALGLQYLQSKGIVHRDLAARNTLIGKADRVKISDFGLSITGGEKKERVLKKMPTRYLSPQTLRNGFFDFTTDMWSFGVMIYEIFHNGPEELYPMLNSAAEVKDYVRDDAKRLGIQDNIEYPQFMWKATVGCWAASSVRRMTVEQLIELIESEDHRLHSRCKMKRMFQKKWQTCQMAKPCKDGWECDQEDVRLEHKEHPKIAKKNLHDRRKRMEAEERAKKKKSSSNSPNSTSSVPTPKTSATLKSQLTPKTPTTPVTPTSKRTDREKRRKAKSQIESKAKRKGKSRAKSKARSKTKSTIKSKISSKKLKK